VYKNFSPSFKKIDNREKGVQEILGQRDNSMNSLRKPFEEASLRVTVIQNNSGTDDAAIPKIGGKRSTT
jgi:hypothetical protein